MKPDAVDYPFYKDEWPWPWRRMLHSERVYFATLNRPRRVAHHLLRLLTAPRFMWPIWRRYRQTWKV